MQSHWLSSWQLSKWLVMPTLTLHNMTAANKAVAAGVAVRHTCTAPLITPTKHSRKPLPITRFNRGQVAAAALVISRLASPKTKRTPGMLGSWRTPLINL